MPSFFIAILAGLLSFLSPCVLPLVPAYLAVLAGGKYGKTDRRRYIWRALLFVLGFSVVFVGLGLGASMVGQILRTYRFILARLGGILLIILGLHQIGAYKIVTLYRERKLIMPQGGSAGAAFIIGVIFAFGWTPCVGPVLAGILALAGSAGQIFHGALLLIFYSLGLGIPFLAAAFAYDSLSRFVRNTSRVTRYFEFAGGLLLIILGLLLVIDRLDLLRGIIR